MVGTDVSGLNGSEDFPVGTLQPATATANGRSPINNEQATTNELAVFGAVE
jgi:hypothetical protein